LLRIECRVIWLDALTTRRLRLVLLHYELKTLALVSTILLDLSIEPRLSTNCLHCFVKFTEVVCVLTSFIVDDFDLVHIRFIGLFIWRRALEEDESECWRTTKLSKPFHHEQSVFLHGLHVLSSHVPEVNHLVEPVQGEKSNDGHVDAQHKPHNEHQLVAHDDSIMRSVGQSDYAHGQVANDKHAPLVEEFHQVVLPFDKGEVVPEVSHL